MREVYGGLKISSYYSTIIELCSFLEGICGTKDKVLFLPPNFVEKLFSHSLGNLVFWCGGYILCHNSNSFFFVSS